jgi:hypothetical protein
MQPVRPEPLLSDEDYGAIEAAVMETARGRWFLAEYARRNRNADTDAVLEAIRRLERLVQSAGSFEAHDEVTRGMADIAQAIAAAQIAPGVPREIAAPVEAQAEPVAAEAGTSEELSPQANQEALHAISEEPIIYMEPETSPVPAVAEHGVEEPAPAMEDIAIEPIAVSVEVPAEQPAEPMMADAEEIVPPAALPEAKTTESPVHEADPAERDVFGELESFLTESIPVPQTPPASDAGAAITETALDAAPASEAAADTASTELFPIIELDEEATEALLSQDPPRQELILPTNHLLTQRWGKELTNEPGEEAASVKEMAEEPLQTGLVTFIDEEPVEDSESVFSAPLRLEPEEAAEPEVEMAQASPAVSPPHPASAPRLTIGEIEAMSFTKKAVLFS